MAPQIRFIVIGAGLIGPRHAELILKRSDCSLFAIVDRSQKGPGVAEACGTLHFCTVDDLFDYCETANIRYPEAAIILTPSDTHSPIGIKLATKGIHLLVEKPLASCVEDCVSLIDYCELLNVKLLIGHHRRFNPYIIAAKDNLNRVGKPIAFQGVWALKKNQQYFDEKPWRRSHALGGGTILINLVHDLDLLQYLLGPIQRVFAELLPRQRKPEGINDHVDEGAALTLRFQNGCCGTFICSDNTVSPFNFESGTGENPLIPHNVDLTGVYRVFGSDGTLSVPDLTLHHQNNMPEEYRSWWLPIESENLPITFDTGRAGIAESCITPPPSLETKSNFGSYTAELPKPFDLQLEHFVNLINGVETEVKCSGHDALRALLCIEAVAKSIETGLPQTIQPIESLNLV